MIHQSVTRGQNVLGNVSEWDWRTKPNVMTPVKNQGSAGVAPHGSRFAFHRLAPTATLRDSALQAHAGLFLPRKTLRAFGLWRETRSLSCQVRCIMCAE
jgi:hypothetical protein